MAGRIPLTKAVKQILMVAETVTDGTPRFANASTVILFLQGAAQLDFTGISAFVSAKSWNPNQEVPTLTDLSVVWMSSAQVHPCPA